MPNHCGNILTVNGSKKDLDAFRAYAAGPGPAWDGKTSDKDIALDLNKFVPVPEDRLLGAVRDDGHISDAFNSGGYEWAVANWGTKWGCYDISVEETKKTLRYRFMTAWSPFTLGVLVAMSEKFKSLKFELKYAEAGCGFGGIMTAEGGLEGDANDAYDEDASGLAKKDSDIFELLGISG